MASVGCGKRAPAHAHSEDSPLGPSFWLNPVPSDDDSLLGRSFVRAPNETRTLEEQSRPNPCDEHLAPVRESASENHYENVVNAETSVRGAGILSVYGFSADVSVASHLLYQVDTSRRLTRMDTQEYLQCCETNDCGWGYVSALIYGEGNYSSGKETSGKVEGNYTVIRAGAERTFSVLSTRKVRGYIAAVITSHDRTENAQRCPVGKVWARYECVPEKRVRMAEFVCAQGTSTEPGTSEEDRLESERMQQDACAWLEAHGLTTPTED